jgi:putative ABC transport system permease protein
MELLHGEIGRTYEIVSYSPDEVERGNAFGGETPFDGPTMTATLVGEWTAATEFDDPTPQVIYSDFLLNDHPDVGTVATLIAVRADPGITGDEITDAARELPGGADVAQFRSRMVSDSARDAIDLQTRALWVVTFVTLAAAALVTVQLVIRHLRATAGDRGPLLALGYRPRQIAGEAAIVGAGIGVIASILAGALAVFGSMFFPMGAARRLDPDEGPRVDVSVLLLTAFVVVITAGAAALAAGISATSGRARQRHVALAERLGHAGAGPAVTQGVRFALSRQRRRGFPPVAFALGIAAALAGILGATVVGRSIDRVTAERDRWGENYDQMFGGSHVPAVRDIVTPIADDHAVRDVTAATIGFLTIEDEDVTVFAVEVIRGSYAPVITSGRAPVTATEIALGRRVARKLDHSVGDVVTVMSASGEPSTLDVVGISVTPEQAGDGAAMTYAGYAALVPDATKNMALVDWNGDVSQADIDRITASSGAPPNGMDKAYGVIALDRVTAAPYLLGVVLIVLTLATIVQMLVSTVRERRYDLAVIHAVGADRRLLRGIIRWNAWTVALIGIVIALPLGSLAGGRVFRSVANDVGVVSTPLVSAVLLTLFAVAVLFVASVGARWPATRAARTDVAVLRRT